MWDGMGGGHTFEDSGGGGGEDAGRQGPKHWSKDKGFGVVNHVAAGGLTGDCKLEKKFPAVNEVSGC